MPEQTNRATRRRQERDRRRALAAPARLAHEGRVTAGPRATHPRPTRTVEADTTAGWQQAPVPSTAASARIPFDPGGEDV